MSFFFMVRRKNGNVARGPAKTVRKSNRVIMPKPPKSETHVLAGPAGRLEAILETPQEGEPTAIVVLCHPHPLYYGTMRNKVVHTLARAFVSEGFAALRFNFRGVGDSTGLHDHGRGETEDAFAALRWLKGRWPALPWWLGGFSFGAMIALKCALREEPEGLVTIAPPFDKYEDQLAGQPSCPWLVVQGDRDELVDVESVVSWMDALEPGPELLVMEDTDHFFHSKLVLLRDAVAEFVRDNRK